MATKDSRAAILAERLDVAQTAVDRLLRHVKSDPALHGKALRRMKLIEQAAQCFEEVRVLS